MAITPGDNTWATVSEADAILSQQVGSADWFALPTAEDPAEGGESKEAYLVTAYRWLKGTYGLAASASASDALKEAQSLAANWLITYREDYQERESLIASGVEEFKWSRWEEKLGSVSPPRFIVDILIGLGVGGSNQAVQLYGDDYDR